LRLLGFVFCDPIGGSDGQEGVVPVVSGPLAPYAAGFASWLRSRAYSPSAAAGRMCQLDQLSRWLGREGLGVGELTGEQAERFVAARRAAGRVTWVSPQSVMLPLEYLRELGVAPAPAPVVAQGPLEELLADYRRYLSIERGLSDHTVLDAYGPAARLFLAGRENSDGLDLKRLCAADVSSFLARECPKRSVSGARDLVCALRSLLRYLHLAGLIDAPLVWAVPSVADLRDRTLPRGLERAAVKKLLASCDRRRLVGRRDYAILLLLARLGLRAGEVAAIQLDDVDWRRGELLVRGKGSRHDVLPLPVDVGEAIVSYLRRRPRCECRALFLRVPAPRRELSRSTIGWVVRAACDRAGLARVGAHRLRHTAATEMLRAGASLPEIGQVLRHREQKTTAIYAKVDRRALRALARPWPSPGGVA
jgi:integrase/recombinase XerD